MNRLLQHICLILVFTYTIQAFYQVHLEGAYYAGGKLTSKGISAELCVRNCRKLGNCWGVDYFRDGGRCAVHMDGDNCDITARREFANVDHFRVKECDGEEYFRDHFSEPISAPEDDDGLAELRRRLDAKMFSSDCYMNIYENSYVKHVGFSDNSLKSNGYLLKSGITVYKCAELCWTQPSCKAIDFEKDGGKCFVFSHNFSVSQLETDTCCHHVLVSCFSDSQGGSSVRPTTFPGAYPGGGYRGVTTTTNTPSEGTSSPTSPVMTPPSRTTTVPFSRSTQAPALLPTKLPDVDRILNKVCPFLFLPGTSRPGGKYFGDTTNTLDACVAACFIKNKKNITCFAVDWNAQTTDCFYFDSEDTSDMLNYTDTYIYHFQYNPCETVLEMQCIVHPPMDLSSSSVIVGPLKNNTHDVEDCDTYCYFNYAFMNLPGRPAVQMLERGCGDELEDYLGWRQCESPSQPTPTSIELNCHCMGHVCNSVGVSALAQIYAYYSFDYNAEDQSGYNRHGESRGTLKFTNMDLRSAGAAAVFDGKAFVTIPGMKLIHRSEVQSSGELRVSSAFTLWIRRMYGEPGPMTIMSNADQRGHSTIGIYSDLNVGNPSTHNITVSVRLMGETFSVSTGPIEMGAWQFICMNIRDSVYQPVMALYLSQTALVPPVEVSSVTLEPSIPLQPGVVEQYLDLTSRTLTIGKETGPGNKYPFKGELDELHFYQGELSTDDIWALMVQGYYP